MHYLLLNYRYYLPALFLLAARPAAAQNEPDLGKTAPEGTATVIAPPAAVTVPPAQQYNYIRSWAPAVQVSNPALLHSSANPGYAQTTTVYQDGFSRNMQVVLHNVQPGQSIVTPSDTRFQRREYSYPGYPAASGSGFRSNAFQEQRSYYNGLYPGEGGATYGFSENNSSSGKRSEISYAPGKSQAGQLRGTESSRQTNSAGEVRLWTLDIRDQPVSTATYSAGQLFALSTKAPNENPAGVLPLPPLSRVYKDKEGRVILQQVSDSFYTASNPGLVYRYTFASTYYVYDQHGRLRYVLPPKATALLEENGWNMTPAILDNLCFQYRYDARGRQTEVKKPGEGGFTELVYDRKDRVVMRRSPLEAERGLWEVSLYDAQGRVKVTGLYSETKSRADMQEVIEEQSVSPLFYQYLNDPALEGSYPAEDAIDGLQIMSYTWYDRYAVTDPNGDRYTECETHAALASGELQTGAGAEAPQRSLRTQGLVTGTKVRILPSENADPGQTGEWRLSVPYYDDKGRVIYTWSIDEYQGSPIHVQCVGNQYDFAGRLLVSKHYIHNMLSADPAQEHTELTRNDYDPYTARLTQTLHQVDAEGWKVLAGYTYDALGRVQRKVLGNNGEVQDFSYNIRGQLTGINGFYAETGDKQGQSRSFGQSLKYDYGFTEPRYDGRMAGMVWRGSNSGLFGRQHAYGYSYDLEGRLKNAEYRTRQNNSMTGWNKTELDYTVSGLYYDKNGNILGMKQRGVRPGGILYDMDQLSYHYKAGGHSNQLAYVSDASGPDSYGLGDFQDHNTGNADYSYDQNGNLNADANKGLEAQFTWFNKPAAIDINGNRIEYSYDAAGNKVQELVTDNTASTVKRTDYIGNCVYESDRLQYMLTAEGRTAFYPGGAHPFKEEFFVKDHLGNVRSVVDIVTHPRADYLASYEVSSANLERLLFNSVDEIRVPAPASTEPGNFSAGLLDGNTQPVGTSILLKVMAGDRVQLNVNNFYEAYNESSDNPLSAADMLSNISATLMRGAGGMSGGESHDVNMVDKLFTSQNYVDVYDNLVSNLTEGGKPKAYLNYVLFDEQMEIVTEMSGAFQADGMGAWSTIGTGSGSLEIPQNGYLAVYLSNRSRDALCSNCGVYFDMLDLRISKGNLLEESHYYPHGLPIAGMGSAADGFKENRRKYQGNEYIKDLGLQWMDFQARQYDPQTGRFLGVDPLADAYGQQVWSPYAAMGNAPESQVDPNGTISYLSAVIPEDGVRQGYYATKAMVPTAEMYMPGGALWGQGKVDLKWPTGLSKGQIDAFWGMISILAQASTGGDIFSDGQFVCNFGGGGGPIDLPVVTVTGKKGFFGNLWGGIKKGVSNGWNWVKGINFHFSLGGEISFGSQLASEVTILGQNIGFDANLGSAQYLQGEVELHGMDGDISGSYYGKNGKIKMKHGFEGGVGIISGGVETEYYTGKNGQTDQSLHANAAAGIDGIGASLDTTIPIGPQTMSKNVNGGLHLDVGAKLKVLIGIEVKISLGITHDNVTNR